MANGRWDKDEIQYIKDHYPNDIANSLGLNNDLTEEDIKFTRAKWSAKERVPAFWNEVRCRI